MSDLIAVIQEDSPKEDQKRFLFIVTPEVDEEEVNFDEWEGTIRSISKVVTKNATKLNKKQDKLYRRLEDTSRKVELHNVDFAKQIQDVKMNL